MPDNKPKGTLRGLNPFAKVADVLSGQQPIQPLPVPPQALLSTPSSGDIQLPFNPERGDIVDPRLNNPMASRRQRLAEDYAENQMRGAVASHDVGLLDRAFADPVYRRLHGLSGNKALEGLKTSK